MCKKTLKEIRKLAKIALCNANDLVECGFSGVALEEDIGATMVVRDKLAEILKQIRMALAEEIDVPEYFTVGKSRIGNGSVIKGE